MANLTMHAAGNLYGTTEYGGSNDFCNGDAGGCGIVFRLSPKTGGGWTETVLHAFHSAPRGSDGCPSAESPLTPPEISMGQRSTEDHPLCSGFGCGTVYKLSPTTTGPGKNRFCTRSSTARMELFPGRCDSRHEGNLRHSV